MKKTKKERATKPKQPRVRPLLAEDLLQISGGGCVCCLENKQK